MYYVTNPRATFRHRHAASALDRHVHASCPYRSAVVQKRLNGRNLSHPQVVDTGVDETSCFFADDDGLEIEHSYMFDGIIIYSSMDYSLVFTSGDFVYDMSRRKVMGVCLTRLCWKYMSFSTLREDS